MIQNALQHLGGIELYGLLSIGLFFLAFLGTLVWALRLKKPFLDTMASLPLDPNSKTSDQPEPSHE